MRRHGDDAAREWLKADGVRLLPRAGEDRCDGAFEAPRPVRGEPPRGGVLGEAEVVRHRPVGVAEPHAAGAAVRRGRHPGCDDVAGEVTGRPNPAREGGDQTPRHIERVGPLAKEGAAAKASEQRRVRESATEETELPRATRRQVGERVPPARPQNLGPGIRRHVLRPNEIVYHRLRRLA